MLLASTTSTWTRSSRYHFTVRVVAVTCHFLFEVEGQWRSSDFRAGQGQGVVRGVWRAASSGEAEAAKAGCSRGLSCLAQVSGGRSASKSHRHPLGADPDFRYHSRQVKR